METSVGSSPTQSANIVGYASAPPNQKKKEMGDYEKIKAIAMQIKTLWPREIGSKVTDWHKSVNSDANPDYEELEMEVRKAMEILFGK